MPDDRANIDALFQEYRPKLFAWLARRIPLPLRRRIDPDDVLQEAFVTAMRKSTQQHAALMEVSTRLWIYAVVRDCYLEHWQRHTRDCRDHRKDEPWPDHSSLQHELELVASATTPSEAAARVEERQRVVEVIRLLPGPDRELLEWHWWEGFSHGEVAAMLRVSEEAARQRYYRSFRRFTRLWQQQPGRDAEAT